MGKCFKRVMGLREQIEVVSTVVEHQLDELDKHLAWIKEKERALKELEEER